MEQKSLTIALKQPLMELLPHFESIFSHYGTMNIPQGAFLPEADRRNAASLNFNGIAADCAIKQASRAKKGRCKSAVRIVGYSCRS